MNVRKHQVYFLISTSILSRLAPGPFIGGRLVDAACVLWTLHGACSHCSHKITFNVLMPTKWRALKSPDVCNVLL